MSPLNVILVAIGLGMDAMSVSMGIGVNWHGPHQRFRMAWHMGLFQFLMPIIGWLAGSGLSSLVAGVAGYIAGAILALVGGKMLYEATRSHPGATAERAEHLVEKELHLPSDPTRGWSLIALSVACSLDALAVGVSLGLKGHPIIASSLVIGAVAAAMVLAGMAVGKRFGARFGKPAEIVGALLLIGLAVNFLVRAILATG